MPSKKSTKARKPESTSLMAPTNEHVGYFGKFPEFKEDPLSSVIINFTKLAIDKGWDPDKKRYKTEYKHLCHDEFNHHFGHVPHGRNVGPWQDLLRELGVEEKDIPLSITKCKKVLDYTTRLYPAMPYIDIITVLEDRNPCQYPRFN